MIKCKFAALLLAFLILGLFIPAHAAITANTIYEVRTTGNATNGGGFDSTIASAGTDMSIYDNKNATSCTSCQSATVNLSKTDAVTNNTTTVTSATANFSSALIGNTVRLSGTGTTSGWYQVTAVASSTSITVDRATGSTGGSGVTINIGGALRNQGDAANYVAGNTIYMKATATYTNPTTVFGGSSMPGASGAPISVIGYTTTRGDNGMVTMQMTSGSQSFFSGAANYIRIQNFILDCNAQTTSTGLNFTGSNLIVDHVEIKNCTSEGLKTASLQSSFNNIWVHGMTSCSTTGAVSVTSVGGGNTFQNMRVNANACVGIYDALSSTSNANTYLGVISDANTGASSDGFQKNSTGGTIILNSVFFNNGRDGVRLNNAAGADFLAMRLNILYSNAGVSINSTAKDWSTHNYWLNLNYNGYASGTLTSVAAGPNDVTITGDPFTSSGSGDFTLNNTAGAGAALRAAGFPGALLSGGTGFMSIGPMQLQAGSAAVPTCPIQ